MNYLELLHLAAPEAIVTVTALLVLTIELLGGRNTASATVSNASRGPAPTSATPGAGQGFDACSSLGSASRLPLR